MKKFLSLFFALSIFIAPSSALAIETLAEEELNIKQAITDDLYGFGGRVLLNERVEGDAVLFGGEVEINNEITQDLTVLGGDITMLESTIKDDLRFAGGNITIRKSTIEGHTVGAGGTIYIDEETIFNGDIKLAGGELRLDGVVNGNVQIAAGQITFGNNASINGDLEYSSETVLENAEQFVAGQVHYYAYDDSAKYKPNASEKITTLIATIIQLSILAGCLYLLAQRFWTDALKTLKKETGKSYLLGIFFALLGWAPFIMILIISVALGLWWFISWFIFIVFLQKMVLCVFGLAYAVEHYKFKNLSEKLLSLVGIATLIELYSFVLSHLVGLNFIIELAVFIGVFAPLIGSIILTKVKIMQTYNKGKIAID